MLKYYIDLADECGKQIFLQIIFCSQISGTIEDPTVYKEIKAVLQKLGYAKTAPDPQ
jgi:hypothetical protein